MLTIHYFVYIIIHYYLLHYFQQLLFSKINVGVGYLPVISFRHKLQIAVSGVERQSYEAIGYILVEPIGLEQLHPH